MRLVERGALEAKNVDIPDFSNPFLIAKKRGVDKGI
jgi:hypothetical protein